MLWGRGDDDGRSHMGEFMGGMHELSLAIPRDTFLVREFLRGILRGMNQRDHPKSLYPIYATESCGQEVIRLETGQKL